MSATIPPEIETALSGFCSELGKRLGANLESVILYGGLAKGEFTPSKSDANLMLVVGTVSLADLDVIREVSEAAQRHVHLSLLTLARADIADSAEVFSSKFLDIQRHHRTLHGKDVAATMVVPRERLKRQCSRELMNLLLRLRQAYLLRSQRTEMIEAALLKAVPGLMANLATEIELLTGQAHATKAAIVAASKGIGLDEGVLRRLLELRSGLAKPDKAALKALFADLLSLLEKAIDRLDAVQS